MWRARTHTQEVNDGTADKGLSGFMRGQGFKSTPSPYGALKKAAE